MSAASPGPAGSAAEATTDGGEGGMLDRADAVIYRDLQPHVTRESFERDIREGRVVESLRVVPARPGECHYLPSGTCHALGAGVLVAEVQTPSDTTFRVYDWGRTGRTIHVEQALECIRFDDSDAQPTPCYEPIVTNGMRTTPLLSTDCFEVERVVAEVPSSLPIITAQRPEVWMVTEGEARIEQDDTWLLVAERGRTVLLPAALEGATAQLSSGTELLRITPPSPTRGMIA